MQDDFLDISITNGLPSGYGYDIMNLKVLSDSVNDEYDSKCGGDVE